MYDPNYLYFKNYNNIDPYRIAINVKIEEMRKQLWKKEMIHRIETGHNILGPIEVRGTIANEKNIIIYYRMCYQCHPLADLNDNEIIFRKTQGN